MAEITLKYNPKDELARKTLEYILSLGVFKEVTEVEESMEEIRKGEVNTYKNVDELFEKVLKE